MSWEQNERCSNVVCFLWHDLMFCLWLFPNKLLLIPSCPQSIFPKCMISWVVAFDDRVMVAVYDDTHQWLLGSCVKFSQTTALVAKGSVRS